MLVKMERRVKGRIAKMRWSGKSVGKEATPAIELGSRAELRKKSKSRVASAS